MNGKKLWAQFWTERQKQSKRNNCIKGLDFLKSYEMTTPKNILKELQAGLGMTIAGKWGSGYVVIMPNIKREEELIRNRLATHPFESSEWPVHEVDGLPNRRYSIFIYDDLTCPQFAGRPETSWRMEYSEGIPIYEKGFNVAFLKRTFPKLKRILISIYQGGTPQPTILKPITTESKSHKSIKQEKQINENQLRAIIAESVGEVLNEKLYNPSVEPMIDRKLGNYEVLEGSWMEQILCDIPQKGWIQGICMYSSADITYALYRRCDNGKYFFTKKVILPDDEYVHTIPISYKTVPRVILNDARTLIRNN